jgi:hypothetical protein
MSYFESHTTTCQKFLELGARLEVIDPAVA